MIRTSKHNISKFANPNKLNSLNNLFNDYKLCLEHYINLIIDSKLPLKKGLSSSELPIFNIKHSRYRQLIYKHASEIIRSQIKKSNEKRYNKYKKIFKYFKKYDKQLNFLKKKYSELNLKEIIQSKYFTKPKLNNLTITLDERFFDIKYDSNYFDNFIKVILPYFNEKQTRALNIKVPLKLHKHSNKLLSSGYSLRNSIQLKQISGKFYINFIWFKEDIEKKLDGDSLGIDIGYKKLIATSNKEIIGEELFNLYQKISNKKQGSKNFKQLLIHRNNLINYYCKNLNLDNVNKLVIEDLKNVKHKSKLGTKINNKLQRWSYTRVINKLDMICEERGINLVKVSPEYTSQTCSCCGFRHRDNRNGEKFSCINCGYEEDADINASINIHNRGVYSPPVQVRDI